MSMLARIRIIFALAALVMMASGGAAFWLKRANDSLQSVQAVTSARLTLLSDLKHQVKDYRTAALAAVITRRRPQEMAVASQFQAILGRLEAVRYTLPTLVDEIKPKLELYDGQLKAISNDISGPGRNRSINDYQSKAIPLEGEIVTALDRAVEEAQADLAAATADRDQGHALTMQLLIAIGCLFLVVLGGIWIVATRALGTIRAMIALMDRVSAGDLDVTIIGTGRRDEVGAMARAVEGFRENALRIRQLQADREADVHSRAAEREATMAALAQSFESSVAGLVEKMTLSAQGVRATSQTMADAASGTVSQFADMVEVSKETTASVRNVATEAGEMTASMRSIARRTEEAQQMTDAASTSARQGAAIMTTLRQSVSKIGQAAELIEAIAAKTNLLALNATIEAARAGSAGRGFAVVAGEVKSLAGQTSKATRDIESLIGAVEAATVDADAMISAINSAMPRLHDVSQQIAGAVREQEGAATRIVGNVEQATRGVDAVAEKIGQVGEAARQTGAATQVQFNASDGLLSLAKDLDAEVNGFICRVRNG